MERLRLSARPWIGIRTRWSARAASSGGQAPGLVAEQPGRRAGQQVAGVVEGDLAVAVGGEHGEPGRLGGARRRPRRRARRRAAGGTGCRRWPGRSWGCRRRRSCPASTTPSAPGGVGACGSRCRRCRGRGRRRRCATSAGRAGRAPAASGTSRNGRPRRRRPGSPVAERGQGAVVDQRSHAARPRPARRTARSRRRSRRPRRRSRDLERGLDGLRAVGKEQPPLGAYRAAAELACLLDAGVARGQGRVGGWSGTRPQEALGALTSSGRAALAVSTSAANAGASLTARSARILRSTSTPARLRPWMKRL